MMNQFKVLGAPGRYIQGQGALSLLPEIVSELSGPAFIVADALVLDLMGADVQSQFDASGVSCRLNVFRGECTREEIARQTDVARASGSRCVIAIGGGKAIDTAKGVSLSLDIPIVVAPTIASNDAPTSRLIVVYDGAHRISEVLKLARNPDFVVVDTSVIAQAPARFLIAGIGDAIAKKFEAGQSAATDSLNFFGGLPTKTALTLCDSCYTTIREHGERAVEAVKNHEVDEHLESIVEANVLLSGLGFESGGLALAHGLTRGLTARKETQQALHGELVAWGLLVQLIAEGRSDPFIDDIIGFYESIDLPRRMIGIGFNAVDEAVVRDIATVTHEEAPYIRNLVDELSLERLIGCIWTLEKR